MQRRGDLQEVLKRAVKYLIEGAVPYTSICNVSKTTNRCKGRLVHDCRRPAYDDPRRCHQVVDGGIPSRRDHVLSWSVHLRSNFNHCNGAHPRPAATGKPQYKGHINPRRFRCRHIGLCGDVPCAPALGRCLGHNFPLSHHSNSDVFLNVGGTGWVA